MTLKLSELLFEEQNPKKLHRLFEEAEGNQESNNQENQKSGDQKGKVSKIKRGTSISNDPKVMPRKKIEITSKFISDFITKAIPQPKDLLEDSEQMAKPLGVWEDNIIKNFDTKPRVTPNGTITLNVFSTKKKNQESGADSADLDFYKELQIIPLYLTTTNEKGEAVNLGGEKGNQEFETLILLPAIGAIINKDNREMHKKLFKLDIKEPDAEQIEKIASKTNKTPKEVKENLTLFHYDINSFRAIPITTKEREIIKQSFIGKNRTKIQNLASKSRVMEDFSNLDLNKLHENSLSSLLYEKKHNSGFQLLTEDPNVATAILNQTQGAHTATAVISPDMLDATDTGDVRRSPADFVLRAHPKKNNQASNVLRDAGILPQNNTLNNSGIPDLSSAITAICNNRSDNRNVHLGMPQQAGNAIDTISWDNTLYPGPNSGSSGSARISATLRPKRNFISGNHDSLGTNPYQPEYNNQNLRVISRSVLDNQGQIQANNLLNFLPELRLQIPNAFRLVGLPGNNQDDCPSSMQRQVNLSIDPANPNTVEYRINNTSFFIKLSTDNNCEQFGNVVASSRITRNRPTNGPGAVNLNFQPFYNSDRWDQLFQNFIGERVNQRIVSLTRTFNDATQNDSIEQKRLKAANYIVAILRSYGRLDFLSFDIENEYNTVASVSDLNEEITGSTGGFNTDSVTRESQADAGADARDAAVARLENIARGNRNNVDEASVGNFDMSQDYPDDPTTRTTYNTDIHYVIGRHLSFLDSDTNFDEGSTSGVNRIFDNAEFDDYRDDLTRVLDDIRSDFSRVESGGPSDQTTERCRALIEYYGQNEDFLEKVFNILISVVRGNADHVPMSGDQGERIEQVNTRGELADALERHAEGRMRSVAQFIDGGYNYQEDGDGFPVNSFIQTVVSHLRSGGRGSNIQLSLDELMERSGPDESSFGLNMNAILRALKQDGVDLFVDLERLDPRDQSQGGTYEQDLYEALLRSICTGIEGIVGEKAKILQAGHVRKKKLIKESLVAGGIIAAAALTAYSSYREIKGWKNIKNAYKKWYEVEESEGTYTEELIRACIPMIEAAMRAQLILHSTSIFLDYRSQLERGGVTIQFSGNLGRQVLSAYRKNDERKSLKQNLSDLGQTIYTQITDETYKFQRESPLGRYITASDIEDVLITSFFKDNAIIRNDFASLIEILQGPGVMEDGFVYNLGIKSLLKENEDSDNESSAPRKTVSYSIEKLRTELTDVITKQVNKGEFRNKIFNAFKKVIRDVNGEYGMIDKKNAGEAFGKVFEKVIGLPKNQAKLIIKDLRLGKIKDSYNRDFANVILENKKLSLLLEGDLIQKVWQNGGDYFIQAVTDGHGKVLVKVPSTALDAVGNFLPNTTIAKNALIKSTDAAYATIINPANSTNITGQIANNIVASAAKDTTSGVIGLDGANTFVNQAVRPGTTGAMDVSFDQLMSGLYDFANIVSLINLASLITRGITSVVMTRQVIKQNKIDSKKLMTVNWGALVGVAIAEVICRVLLANKEALQKQGVKLQGELKMPKSGEQSRVASDELVATLRTANPKLKGEEIDDESIKNFLENKLTTLCTSIVKRYDKDRYEKIVNYADKDSLAQQRQSHKKGTLNFLKNVGTLGIRSLIKSKATDLEVADQIDGTTIKSNRQKSLFDNVKDEVSAIVNLILGLVKSKKGIEETRIFAGNLSNLLFEADASKPSISTEELRKRLEKTGVLIYGADIDEDSKEFKRAENRLIGTIASILEFDFAINVTGVDEFKAINLDQAVVEQTVNQEAEAGTPASPEVREATSTAGLPPSMSAPANMDQMAGIVNMMGGNPMMMFMMMMMNPQFMQQMMKMQNSGNSTMQDMVQAVAGQNSELGEFEKDFAQALQEQRTNLPLLDQEAIKKLIKLLKQKPLEKINNVRTVSLAQGVDLNDTSIILDTLKQSFRLTKSKQDYAPNPGESSNPNPFGGTALTSEVMILANSICNNIYNVLSDSTNNSITFSNDESIEGVRCAIWYGCIKIAEKALGLDNTTSEALKDYMTNFYRNTVSTNLDNINVFQAFATQAANINAIVSRMSANNITVNTSGAQLQFPSNEELNKFIKLFGDAFTGVENAIEVLKESSNRYNKPVLRREPVKKSRVINESEFLKKEFKRLWKL